MEVTIKDTDLNNIVNPGRMVQLEEEDKNKPLS